MKRPTTQPYTTGSVMSADGTTIGYRQLGCGPGVVVVHGTMRSAEDYMPLADCLASTFTVYVVDRRGRGTSGVQGPDYGLQKEADDLRAVLQRTGATLCFGHSFGGVVALEAALTHRLTRLALFEPALSIDDAVSGEALQTLASALEAKNYGEAMITVFDVVGDGLPVLLRIALRVPILRYALFAGAVGKRLRPLLDATLAEARVTREANATYRKYEAVDVETLLMHGTRSPAWLLLAANHLAQTLPRCQSTTFDEVGHSAPCEDAPKRVADALKAFFASNLATPPTRPLGDHEGSKHPPPHDRPAR